MDMSPGTLDLVAALYRSRLRGKAELFSVNAHEGLIEEALHG